jgi:uncharacterized membrane protein
VTKGPELSTSIHVAAAPARVWSVMMDLEHWPVWTPTVTSIRRLDEGPLRPGARVRIRQPRLLPTTWTTTEVHPDARFTWESRGTGLTIVASHAVEAAPGGSRVTLTLRFDGLLGRFAAATMRGLSQAYIETEAAGLKRRSESPA